MGPQSLHLVALAAVFVAIALTMQCTLELERYQAQDLAGAVISLGLLRRKWASLIIVSLALVCRWGLRSGGRSGAGLYRKPAKPRSH